MEVEEELHYEGEYFPGEGCGEQAASELEETADYGIGLHDDAYVSVGEADTTHILEEPRHQDGGFWSHADGTPQQQQHIKTDSANASEGVSGGGRRTQYRVLARNLDPTLQWQDLKDFGRQAGEVNYANVISSGGRRVGLIEYFDSKSMTAALRQLDGSRLRTCRVRLSADRGEFDSFAASGGRGGGASGPPPQRTPPARPRQVPAGGPACWPPLQDSPDARYRERGPTVPARDARLLASVPGAPPRGGGDPQCLRLAQFRGRAKGDEVRVIRHRSPNNPPYPARACRTDTFVVRRAGRSIERPLPQRIVRSPSPHPRRHAPVHAGYREMTTDDVSPQRPPAVYDSSLSREDYQRLGGGACNGTGSGEGSYFKHDCRGEGPPPSSGAYRETVQQLHRQGLSPPPPPPPPGYSRQTQQQAAPRSGSGTGRGESGGPPGSVWAPPPRRNTQPRRNTSPPARHLGLGECRDYIYRSRSRSHGRERRQYGEGAPKRHLSPCGYSGRGIQEHLGWAPPDAGYDEQNSHPTQVRDQKSSRGERINRLSCSSRYAGARPPPSPGLPRARVGSERDRPEDSDGGGLSWAGGGPCDGWRGSAGPPPPPPPQAGGPNRAARRCVRADVSPPRAGGTYGNRRIRGIEGPPQGSSGRRGGSWRGPRPAGGIEGPPHSQWGNPSRKEGPQRCTSQRMEAPRTQYRV